MGASDSLVGRQRELADLVDLLRGQGHGVVVVGDAGVGKTTLVRAALEQVEGEVAVHQHVATRAAATVPFGALLSLLPADAVASDEATPSVARQLLGQLDAGRGQTSVLAVDDAHLLDDASAAIVLEAARTARANVVVTLRAGEDVPDAITALWKDGYAERVELPPLDRPALADLIGQEVGGPVDAGTVDRLWRITGGNPLFAHEVVGGAVRSGALREYEGLWVLRGEIPVDQRLQDAIKATIGAIDDDVRELTELVAAGERVPLPLLEGIFTIDTIARAEEQGVIRTDVTSGLAQLTHPLHGEAIRSTMAGTRVRTLRATLAAAALETSDRALLVNDPLVTAVWLLDGGGAVDRELYLDAAVLAIRLRELTLAVRLGNAVLASGPDPRAALLVAMASNRRNDGETSALTLDGYAELDLSGEMAFRLAFEEMSARFWILADVDGADRAIDRWIARSWGEPWDDLLLTIRANIELWSGRFDTAEETATPLFDEGKDERVRVLAFGVVSMLWARKGQTDRVVEGATPLLPAALAMRHLVPEAPTTLVGPQIIALTQQGRLDEVERLMDLFEAVYEDKTDLLLAMAHGVRGTVATVRGTARSARTHLESSIALQRAAGQDHRAAVAWILLTEACALCGDRSASERALAAAQAALGPNEALMKVGVDRAEIWVAFVTEGAAAAREVATTVVERSRRLNWSLTEFVVLFDQLRLGEDRAVDDVIRVGARIDGPWAAVVTAHARAMKARDGAALDDVAQRYADLTMWLFAAEAAAMAADRHRRQGDVAAAGRAEEQSRLWIAMCEGARSPVLDLRQPDVAVGLTAREREIAQMAARGRSNRDLADELGVSIRTVEGHLARAYAKLGVSSRQELSDLLGSS